MVQKEKLEKLISYARANNFQLVASEEELNSLFAVLERDEKTLKYSNDDEIDMIVVMVCAHINDTDLRDFLETVNIQNLSRDYLNARALLSSDEFHRVETTEAFLRKIQRLSDIASTIFIQNCFLYPQLATFRLIF